MIGTTYSVIQPDIYQTFKDGDDFEHIIDNYEKFVDILKIDFIPSSHFDIYDRILAKEDEEKCLVIHSYSSYETRKEYMSRETKVKFITEAKDFCVFLDDQYKIFKENKEDYVEYKQNQCAKIGDFYLDCQSSTKEKQKQLKEVFIKYNIDGDVEVV